MAGPTSRRVSKAPGAGSYRAKKGAKELAHAARRISAKIAAAAAYPSLPPNSAAAIPVAFAAGMGNVPQVEPALAFPLIWIE